MARSLLAVVLCLTCSVSCVCCAQEAKESVDDTNVNTSKRNTASIKSAIANDGTGRIIVEARGQLPEANVFYTTQSESTVKVGEQRIEQTVLLSIKVIQGNAKTISLGINGDGRVISVAGDQVKSWAIREEGKKRFLDLSTVAGAVDIEATIGIQSAKFEMPVEIDLTHLAPGDSVGFDSRVRIAYQNGVEGAVVSAGGFSPLEAGETGDGFQTSTGGKIALSVSRSGTSLAPVELVETRLSGDLHENGDSIHFRLRGSVEVRQAQAEITILSGSAAVNEIPKAAGYRLRLAIENNEPVYRLVFTEPGVFPLSIDFVASLAKTKEGERIADFAVAAGAIVPMKITGLPADLEFRRDQHSTVPSRDKEDWVGFLPASGRARLQWKEARQAGAGKVFFATTGQVETKVGVGLLRQDHLIGYQVLQGELPALSMLLHGSGEILDVQGSNIVAWKVTELDQSRQLDITISQPLTGASTDSCQIRIRSQTPLGAFPVRVQGVRLDPVGAIRHSGHLRLSNSGSVRLEPTLLTGLTQLSPSQFPGDPIEARQVFVYRFPAADHSFTVAADRIQPEVSVSELVLYELAETDRVIKADIELDIREAPIREWDFGIPADYSIVSVTGANVADYVSASEIVDGRRNLKAIFRNDVSGRQLVSLHLEKNIATAEGDWVLPRIEYEVAKNVRGDIGIVATPGFRVEVGETKLLVEKPLAYFPKPTLNLQQAFRIREPDWSATLQIQQLERNVQSDVFHLYSLSQGTAYGSALINYFITGAPVSELELAAPAELGNLMVDGQNVRTWRREDGKLIVSLHQAVIGPYVLLVTFEEKPDESDRTFQAGRIRPLGVQGERGYIQVVSPVQVEVKSKTDSDELLVLDPLELPAEFRLLTTAPSLGTWQYTERPFNLNLTVNWFQPGATVTQLVEFCEANSRVSRDGELVTDVLYYVKSRGRRTFQVTLPKAPVRLWEVSVNGQPVTARQANQKTLIPLPGETDPNVPVEVRLRLGKPAVNASYPSVALPVVDEPVLKTQWNLEGDERRVLVPVGGTVAPPVPVLRPIGFEWVAKQGLISLLLIALCAGIGVLSRIQSGRTRVTGLIALVVGMFVAVSAAVSSSSQIGSLAPLQLSLPVLSAGELVELEIHNTPVWQVDLSWLGVAAFVVGAMAVIWSFLKRETWYPAVWRAAGMLAIAIAVLLQGGGAPWFFGLLAISLFVLLFIRPAWKEICRFNLWRKEFLRRRRESKTTSINRSDAETSKATATIVLLAMALSIATTECFAVVPKGFSVADSIRQQCELKKLDKRLTSRGTITVTGVPGDRFVLLKAPAILTQFEGKGLRLTKAEISGQGLCYVITIPIVENLGTRGRESAGKDAGDDLDDGELGDDERLASVAAYSAEFQFQLEVPETRDGIPVLTGTAAVQQVDFRYDEAGWAVESPEAVLVESVDSESTQFNLLLAPGEAQIFLRPRARDVASEKTQFFVEASNLYLPGPGGVDGRHRLQVRPSQGQVSELKIRIPDGLTVSAVSGPVDSWQFNADTGGLNLTVEPPQYRAFEILVETQRGLDPLPTEVRVGPIRVSEAAGEVGLVAIAFGQDAQPEKLESNSMSEVNLGDFDASLIPKDQAAIHRVYRYGTDGGQIEMRVAPVGSEVRVVSKQVLSLGEERVVLGVNFSTEISRAGLFQLSFPLPPGLEVESLTGGALHHWSELSEGAERKIILHLNSKTIGKQVFALTLTGAAPADAADWGIPRFEIIEATRQSGELFVRPATGIRLRTVTRQNVSEADPRVLEADGRSRGQGELAFRLLQSDWNLVLGIEQLDPWVTGEILHDVTLREGQTRSTLYSNFNVQNASIRSLQVVLPMIDDEEIKTLRASGNTVSDFVRIGTDSRIWEVRFKRRVIGATRFQIEYERRGDRMNDIETLRPAAFPETKQLSYHLSVRAGGRLEVDCEELSQGWLLADWSTVPSLLRESGVQNVPAICLRAVNPKDGLRIKAQRHSLADALKLRVAEGALLTVLSPTGNQLTAVDLTMEVIQRSNLSIGLPTGAELLSIFVNGESVHSIRRGGDSNVWQFYILPGMDERTAKVRFVYSVAGKRVRHSNLMSPKLNVPLENMRWNVVAPRGYELTDNDGNLELVRRSNQKEYDRDSYLSIVRGKRQVQAQQATQLLEQANQLLQAGEQAKASWALKSVANQYALDAASNEDARVQLENLQTQQAIVGLNTRRQRLYLDNKLDITSAVDNVQLRQAAADNPILQLDRTDFRPQEISQLLRGNTSEDNAVLQQIAGRLVQHQRTTEPAPQGILISLPEEGAVYTFGRTVQVTENSPLELDLSFGTTLRIQIWRVMLVLILLASFVAVLASSVSRTATGN